MTTSEAVVRAAIANGVRAFVVDSGSASRGPSRVLASRTVGPGASLADILRVPGDAELPGCEGGVCVTFLSDGIEESEGEWECTGEWVSVGGAGELRGVTDRLVGKKVRGGGE